MTDDYCLPSTSRITAPDNEFISSISMYFERVLQYEDPEAQKLAKSCVPLVTMQTKSLDIMRDIQKSIKEGNGDLTELSMEDVLIVQLMDWFKSSFFKWVDKPPCYFCNGPTELTNTAKKFIDGESLRVEVFKCGLCEEITKFPRHNKATTLLRTRSGRCGEWANCFTLLCRALGYDARLIVDSTDHVWTEVYSLSEARWIHCDPCENAIDKPLLYEAGWGKKLSYVIAYSRDEVQDVTWRYSSDHRAVLSRRNKCAESTLISTLISLREKRWKSLSEPRKIFVKRRLCKELVELMVERKPDDKEKIGRISGSLKWRMDRKEVLNEPYKWKIDECDVFCIKYQTSSDCYHIFKDDIKEPITKVQNWINRVYTTENIKRKEETDWKMVYLCRTENSDKARISWNFNIDRAKLLDRVVFKLPSQSYKSGAVTWTLSFGDERITIPKLSELNFVLDKCDDIQQLVLTADLVGGEGDVAWQHTQIFRQELDSRDYAMEIKFILKNK